MMKKILLKLTCIFVLTGIAGSAYAQSMPDRIVEITEDKVSIRDGAGATSPIIKEVEKGRQYVLVAEKGAWYEIKDPVTNETGFVSNTVAITGKPVNILDYLNSNPDMSYLSSIDKTAKEGYEQSYTYSFWTEGDDTQTIFSWLTDQYANLQGQTRTNEKSYKGQNCGWYLKLEKELDLGGNEVGDITPIVFYKSIKENGLYSGGLFYKPVPQSTF